MGALGTRIKNYINRDRREDIQGPMQRIENIAFINFRGILGFIFPILFLTWVPSKDRPDLIVTCIWIWMFWFWLIQPVSIPCTAMIPIFMLPMCGILSSNDTVKCYFNDGIAALLLGSMILLLLNNSGFDRRLALCILNIGGDCHYAGNWMVLKCSTAAYILSMFSNRLLVTSMMTEYITPMLMEMSKTYGKTVTNFDEMRYILNNVIQTSSAIGSLAIIHASYVVLLCRALWTEMYGFETPDQKLEMKDIFNYMNYSAYAFPVTFIMYLFNFCYHQVLMSCRAGKAMTPASRIDLRNRLLKLQKDKVTKKISSHEGLTVFFTFVILVVLFTRWSRFLPGWAYFNIQTNAPEIPVVKDTCILAVFVILLHTLPKSLNFLKIWFVERKSELTNLKPESAILWWRFVDKNTNYGYIFVFGAAIALYKACLASGLGIFINLYSGRSITNLPWYTGLFVISFISCLLANVMTEAAAVACILPFVISMTFPLKPVPLPIPWATKSYLTVLGVCFGSSLGFSLPFLYTPAYFCHHTGKVPIIKMIIYNIVNVFGCILILWFSLCYWAPYVFDPNDYGFGPGFQPTIMTTTGTGTTEGGGGGGGGDAGGGGGEEPPAF